MHFPRSMIRPHAANEPTNPRFQVARLGRSHTLLFSRTYRPSLAHTHRISPIHIEPIGLGYRERGPNRAIDELTGLSSASDLDIEDPQSGLSE